MEAKPQEELWTALEVAVRTPAEPLPVDAFLPDPREEVLRVMEERARSKRTVTAETPPAALSHDDSFQEIVEQTEMIEPSPPANDAGSLEEELRSKLSGNSFADLDDV
jgi:hypothetical protein